MTEAEFKAGIRAAIEAALMDGDNTIANGLVRREEPGILFIESEIDLTELAAAVHKFIVETLAPPFAPTRKGQ